LQSCIPTTRRDSLVNGAVSPPVLFSMSTGISSVGIRQRISRVSGNGIEEKFDWRYVHAAGNFVCILSPVLLARKLSIHAHVKTDGSYVVNLGRQKQAR
jgi:hypothetical protein